MTQTDQLARIFAELLESELLPVEFAEVRRRNATPDYQHDCICASHDVCDANMIMWAAFEIVTGHPPAFVEDMNAEQSAAEMKLWNEAWTLSKDLYLTEKAQ